MAPAYLVRCEETALVVDCGSGSTTSVVRAGVRLETLAGVVLTHLHLDHTADLPVHLFALSNPVQPARSTDLQIWGPAGTAQHVRGLRELYGRWVEPQQVQVTVSELADGEVANAGTICLAAYAVDHTESSLAYRLEHGRRSVCFSGDSAPCPGLDRAAAGADLFICECAATDGDPVAGHMRPADVGRTAARAGCGRVVLTHIYPHVEQTDPAARVRELYSGPVELAEDGLWLEL
jgi:ribonuclease BN (tRNA processing enzyme)